MRWLPLLFVLECYALTIPSINNPAIWNSTENWELKEMRIVAFRYSEPFENFHNGKTDIAWSNGSFLAAAGFGSAVLDSIYRELEFSGSIAYKLFNYVSFKIGETANISWIPENASWQEHRIFTGADFYYKDWAKITARQKMYLASNTPAAFSWDFSGELRFSSLYSFGVEFPEFRLYQQITLGYFNIYNSFAYPGPVLGFGFTINGSAFFVGAGHLRSSYPNGHTGFIIGL
jgi:hypothetical protein